MRFQHLFFLVLSIFASCISTKNTIKTINDQAQSPKLDSNSNSFIITTPAKDKKYGYHEDYPINVGFTNIGDGINNEIRFLNALAGPNGEKITYRKIKSCCPFSTKKTDMGAGVLDIYEINWQGCKSPKMLYLNKFEKGDLYIPFGLTPIKR